MSGIVSNGKVTIPRPVNVAEAINDISELLGTEKKQSEMCISKAINWWAKFKPIRHEQKANVTEQQRKEANYGIGIPALTWQSLIASTDSEQRRFVYLQPRAGIDASRLRDFDGYNHNVKATIVVGNAIPAKLYYDVDNDLDFYIQRNEQADACGLDDFEVAPTLAATDVKRSLGEWFACALIVSGGRTYIFNTKKTSNEVGGGAFTIAIPSGTFAQGSKMQMYFCLFYAASWPQGLTELSAGLLPNNLFIPLNVDAQMKGEKQVEFIVRPSIFENFSIVYDQLLLPESSAARNYYQFGTGGANGYMVYSATMQDNSNLANHEFRREIYIKRGSQILQAASWKATDTITFSWSAAQNLASYNFGKLIFEGSLTTQSGDELWLRITWLPKDDSGEQKLYDAKQYTYV